MSCLQNKEMRNPILRLALPSIVTNITVPLLGIVDLAIVGHIPTDTVHCLSSSWAEVPTTATIIGAVAVGTLIFNMVYWLFNFRAWVRADSQLKLMAEAMDKARGASYAWL